MSARFEALEKYPACAGCGKPEPVCVCDRLPKVTNKVRVVILQHPSEAGNVLGTAGLLEHSLASVRVSPGLSWRSLEHAAGSGTVDNSTAIVFPKSYGFESEPRLPAKPAEVVRLDRDGNALKSASPPKTILFLDASWSHAKTIWWQNAWLLRLQRIWLFPREASLYGKLRKEPSNQYVSTLEAAAIVLDEIDPAVGEARADLMRLLRTYVQRVRDFDPATAAPPPEPKTKVKKETGTPAEDA